MPDEPLMTSETHSITVRAVQNQIADAILLIGIIVGVVGVIIILTIEPLWRTETVALTALTLLLMSAGLLRSVISYTLKTSIMIIVVYAAGIINLVAWGMVGSSAVWFILTVLLAMIFHTMRVGLVVYGLVIVTLAIISALFQLNMLRFVPNLETYLTSPIWWYARILMIVIVCAMIVATIGRIIAVLQSQLKHSQDVANQLEQRTDDLIAEVQKREQAEQALATVIDELKILDSLKDNFIDGVSHELRTPLANIQLYHQLLGMKPDKMQSYLPTLTKETERLSHIVEQMLYASTEYDNLQLMTMVEIDLLKLIHQLVNEQSERISEKNLKLDLQRIETQQQFLTLAAPEHLYRAVNNVLDNAIKYTPLDGSIAIDIQEHVAGNQRIIALIIRNTGECPSKDERKLIFERFYRGASALNMGVAGAGLGLPITQQILSQYGGLVSLHCDDDRVNFTMQMVSVLPMEQILQADSPTPSSSA